MGIRLSILALVLATFIFWIGPATAEVGDSTIEIFEIGPSKVDCYGAFPIPQKCLIVNGSVFYSSIRGFDYEEGYEYTLKINKTQEYDETSAPLDSPSIYRYSLVEEISKQKVSRSEGKNVIYWIVGPAIIGAVVIIFLIIFFIKRRKK